MANSEITKFKEENPSFPSYILDELEKELPAKVSPADTKKVLEAVSNEYQNARISPYESIGVITAQSVGEPSTQMTLNTFHFAGVAAQSVEGLPRLIEILDAKKNLQFPMMRLYLKKRDLSEDKVKVLASKIKETRLLEFVTNVEVDVEEKKVVIDLDLKALKKVDLDADSLISYLDKKIRTHTSIEGKQMTVKGTSSAGLKDLMNIKELALSSIVFGIKGISDVTLIKEGDEIVIITSGIALKQVAALPEIDVTRLYCNDIFQTYDYFGIEAARQVIITEIMDVVKSQGLSINDRHVFLIADAMTAMGEPKGMTRFGIVANKQNVLTRASFETPIKHISLGSLMNEENELSTITENVMTNQLVKVGTGIPKIAVKSNK